MPKKVFAGGYTGKNYTNKLGSNTPRRSPAKRILCIETNKEYPSALDAAEKMKLNNVRVSENARNYDPLNPIKHKGFSFKYLES